MANSRPRFLVAELRSTVAMTMATALGRAQKSVIVAIGVLSLATTQARADWEYARWGMTPEQLVAASKGAAKIIPKAQQQSNDAMKLTTKVEAVYSDGPLKLNVKFAFDPADHLQMLGYETLDPAQAQPLKDWLVKKYGPPTHSDPPLQRTSSFLWEKPDEILLTVIDGVGASAMQNNQK